MRTLARNTTPRLFTRRSRLSSSSCRCAPMDQVIDAPRTMLHFNLVFDVLACCPAVPPADVTSHYSDVIRNKGITSLGKLASSPLRVLGDRGSRKPPKGEGFLVEGEGLKNRSPFCQFKNKPKLRALSVTQAQRHTLTFQHGLLPLRQWIRIRT